MSNKPINDRTYEEVASRYSYDPITGNIYYRQTDYRNRADGRGDYTAGIYRHVWFPASKGRRSSYMAHRIAWLLHYGEWPTDQIDHIDGDPHNNAITNLRVVTMTQNLRNRRTFKNNKLGVKGVCVTPYNTFRAQLWKDGKFILQKSFKTLAEATAAYEEAALAAFGDYHRKTTPKAV
ncbi:HNH endonuclease signature motif containing protein [Brevundimonas sp. M1A4_2e]